MKIREKRNKMAEKIIIAGGGTGGHIFPAIALAKEIKRKDVDVEIVFVGGRGALEEKIIPKEGYRLVSFDVTGIKKKSIVNKISSIFKASKAIFKALKFLKEERPDMVVGCGSYSSGPVVLAAWLLHIKTAVLEQNAVPGLTNRILGRIANRVFISYDESKKYFPPFNTYLTGTPVRRDIAMGPSVVVRKKQDKLYILVYGGSQGATAINAAFLDSAEYLTDIWSSLEITHQTGEEGFEHAKNSYERKNLQVNLCKFIDDMSTAYAMADLAICRAGATSIAELSSVGVPAILIPYPFASDDHQSVNARKLEKKGAAKVLKQEKLTGKILAEEIRNFYKNREKLEEARKSMKALGKIEAAKDIVENIYSIMEEQKDN